MQLDRTVGFASPMAEKLVFYSMTGREELGRLFSYEVDLLSQDDSLDLSELLGHPASVLLERSDGTLREFNGFVTRFSLVGQHRNFVRYRAVLHPWLWFLGQTKNSRIFQACKVPDVVKEIFREHGFSDFEEAYSTPSYRQWEYLVQYRESDLNFVSRILEQEGIHYFFKHAGGKHVLVLADSNNAHRPSPGYEAVPFFPDMARERRQQEHLDTWSSARQVRPAQFSARDFQFKTAEVVAAERRSPLDETYPEYDVFDFPGEFADAEQAEAQVLLRLEEHQVDYETVQGGGPVRGLMAGSRFTLTHFPRDDQNRDYLVVSAAYDLQVSEYESHLEEDVQPVLRFEFVGIDAKRPYRVPRRTKKPRVEGPQTAIVVGPEHAEIHADDYRRVLVKFHWDRAPEANEKSSCWIRVSQLSAGQNWGGMHIPRVGQEVIVDFLEGDPDRPIITGRVYNQAQMPPYTLPVNATQSGIKSRSSAEGAPSNFNELRFEDKKGSEELHFQAEKDMSTLVKHDRSTTVKGSRSAGVGHDDSVSVTGDRSVTVNGNLSVDVKGGGKSPVHSTHSVTGKHSVDASDTIEMTAPTHIQLAVGDSVILITPAAINIIAKTGASLTLDANAFGISKSGSQVLLDVNANLQAKGEANVLLDGNACVNSKGGSQLLLDANAAVGTSGNVKLDGASVKGKGKDELSLVVAGSSIALSGDTTVVAAGMINVNGMGMVSIAGVTAKVN